MANRRLGSILERFPNSTEGDRRYMRCAVRFAFVFACVAAFTVSAQNTPTQNMPTPFARSFCIKIQPGKNAEFVKLMADVSKPVAQIHADAGEFSARLLIRAVYPAG